MKLPGLSFTLFTMILFFSSVVFAENSAEIDSRVSNWEIYSNGKYGYEIRYPKLLVLFFTGPPDKRDGRQFKITNPNLSFASEIDVSIHRGKSIEEIAKVYLSLSGTMSLRDRVQKANRISDGNWSIELKEIRIGQQAGIIVIVSFGGEQRYFEIYLDGVRFSYHQRYGLPDGDLAREIIATFQFVNDKKRR